MKRFRIFALLTFFSVSLGCLQAAPASPLYEPKDIDNVAERIRDEGLNRSQVMDTLSYLTEVIGPRLTASPSHKRANEWTRDRMVCWGLTNAHLEAFGPFGKGWSLKSFSIQLVEPQAVPLIAYPKAWSAGLANPISAEVIHFVPTNTADLDRYKGKLKGKIVLTSPAREVRTRFEPLAMRLNETNLLRLANSGAEARGTYGARSSETGPRAERTPETRLASATNSSPIPLRTTPTNSPAFRGGSGLRYLKFLAEEGAALIINASPAGEAGVVFVSSASPIQVTNRPWSTNAEPTPPQVTMAAEDYNRVVRMLERGEKVKMAADLRVQFHEEDLDAYNTIAEIPGTDLRDEIVMAGGHLDSWHAGTGATDNAIGVAVVMEAARIITTLGLKPRRTIRIALWAGEEQGLLGSKAYVARHFGYFTNAPERATSDSISPVSQRSQLRSPKDETLRARQTNATARRSARRLVRLPDYNMFSAYFNLDNGAGRIRGIHLQANEAVGPYFRRWLQRFKDLDGDTVSLSNTRGTDHLSFDAIGLPAFQFIQDPLDYNTRTHHSNQDVLDRVIPEDAFQAAVIMAQFIYNAATIDELLPRKEVE